MEYFFFFNVFDLFIENILCKVTVIHSLGHLLGGNVIRHHKNWKYKYNDENECPGVVLVSCLEVIIADHCEN